MNKEKELAKNTAIITFGKICTQLVSFLLLPLYTSILNAEEYGTVDLIITYSTLLLPFVTLALEQALFRFLIDIRNNHDLIRRYISTTFCVTLSILTIVELIVFLIYIRNKNMLLVYFGLVLFSCTISSVALQIARGLGDNLSYTLASTMSAIGQVCCNVITLAVFRMGVIGMILSSFVGNMICGIIIFIRCNLKQYIGILYFDKEIFSELCKYSLPLIPNQLSWWALNASDKIIVQIFIGIAGNGLIAVANKFSGVYIQLSNIFNISWTESVALCIHDDDAELFISKTINSVYRLFLSMCCGIIVCMPFVFPIMINKQYNEAYNLIPIFMMASLFNVVVSLYGVIYVAHKKTVEIAKTAIYAAMLNVITHIVLIKFIGIYAAAFSTMIGYGGMAIYRYFHSRKYIIIKFNRNTIVSSAFIIIISLLSYYSENKFFQLLAFLVIAASSCILNREFILDAINLVINKIKK